MASGLTETVHGMLLFTVTQMCRAWITAEPIPEATEDLIESTRFALASVLGDHLPWLRRTRFSQNDFGVHAQDIAERIAVPGVTRRTEPDDDGCDGRAAFHPSCSTSTPTTTRPPSRPRCRDAARWGRAETDTACSPAPTTRPGRSRPSSRPELLQDYRERLDLIIDTQHLNARRLGRQLARARGTVPRRMGRRPGRGIPRRSPARPARHLAHRAQTLPGRTHRARTDTTVTFLIDCSGSMKEFGEPVAVLVDVFARALELADARCEILGFTTAAWNGGRARRDWLRSGRPRNPGRLNEVRQLVFKDADTPTGRARPAIAGLLKIDLFKEGVDGEAVDWACSRMRGTHSAGCSCVISDGSPLDGATAWPTTGLPGPPPAGRPRRPTADVEIYGVGVGLDLSLYYDRCRTLDLSSGTTRRRPGRRARRRSHR